MYFGLKVRAVEDKVLSPFQSNEIYALLSGLAEKRRYYYSVDDRLTKLVVDGQATASDLEDLCFVKKNCLTHLPSGSRGVRSRTKTSNPNSQGIVAVPRRPFSGELLPEPS